MSTVRARFDGKVFVPERAVQLPIGEIVEVQFSDSPRLELGTAAALLQAMKTWPKISEEDVAEMERHIEASVSPADYSGIFDDLREENDQAANGG
jgi:hypothetical protein